MKKKPAAKLKKSTSKQQKKKAVMTKRARIVQMPTQAPKKLSLADDPRFAQAVQNYEAGLRYMQERKFERAKAAFLRVAAGPSKELADRVTVHLSAVNQSLARTGTSFKSPEEHYDYAVSLMNTGGYDSAREHLEKMAKQYPKTDYVWYGLAVLDALQDRSADALKHLDEAIKLNAGNRIQARNDSDFQSMFDDPRFTELLYPEATEPVSEPQQEKPSSQRKGR
jgi:tetratricopeptide (TPR) repeat protein